MDNEISLIERFHGHVGPYAMLGYLMGRLASREVGSGYKDRRAVVYTGQRPPLSCLIDGIQLSSGCTMGKGNIAVEDRGEARARFSDRAGKWMEVTLAPGLQERIASSFHEKTEHQLCDWIWNASESELFKVARG